jgi:hypothetical protein
MINLKRKYYEILHPKWVEEKACVKGYKRYFPDVAKEIASLPLDVPNHDDIMMSCYNLTRDKKYGARSHYMDGAKWAINEIIRRNK